MKHIVVNGLFPYVHHLPTNMQITIQNHTAGSLCKQKLYHYSDFIITPLPIPNTTNYWTYIYIILGCTVEASSIKHQNNKSTEELTLSQILTMMIQRVYPEHTVILQ